MRIASICRYVRGGRLFVGLLALATCCLSLFLACAPSSTVNYAQPAQTQSTPAQPVVSAPVPEGAKEILADGASAIIAGDKGIARDHALQDAQRKAVEQGVGTLINSETVVKNFQVLSDQIYSRASGYVSSYKILSEEAGTDLYRVTIRAVVKLTNIEKDLSAIGLLVEAQGRPRLMVIVRDTKEGSDELSDPTVASDLETMLIDQFVSKNFPVVDAEMVKRNLTNDQVRLIMNGDDKTAVLLGMKLGAEIVVAGKATYSEEQKADAYTKQLRTVYGTKLNVRAVNTQTSEVLAATVTSQNAPFQPEAARRNAADDAGNKLISAILKKWQTQNIVTQIYCANADNDKLKLFQAGLNTNIRGLSRVLLRDFTGASGVVEVLATVSSQEVYDRLNAPGWNVAFVIKGFSGNRIDIEFK